MNPTFDNLVMKNQNIDELETTTFKKPSTIGTSLVGEETACVIVKDQGSDQVSAPGHSHTMCVAVPGEWRNRQISQKWLNKLTGLGALHRDRPTR